MRSRLLGLVLPLLLLQATGAEAESSAKRVERWNNLIQSSVDLLRRGESQVALEALDGLLDEMIAAVDPGKKAKESFALVLTLRSLAEAGVGRERESAWDWQVAQQLDPQLESRSFDDFGPPALLLRQHRLSVDPPPEVPTEKLIEAAGGKQPAILNRPELQYVENARTRRWQGKILLSCRLRADGLLTHPRFEDSPSEIGALVQVLEAWRGARFEPAQLDGKPTATTYELTVNFRLE